MPDPGTGSGAATWDEMAERLLGSLAGRPTGFVLEIGPRDYVPVDDEPGDVVCAQIHVLADGVLMVRRSRRELARLMLVDHSPAGLALDLWHFDDHFDDCTDGYLFSRDVRLVVDTCVTWFRDAENMSSADELGCSFRFPDELPRTDTTMP
ncbi:hypothetical protein ACIBED_03445 [Rhodococcus coprophilus]|uniref:Uncharacterized protein n=1 Tax=Rhodococcus coprophilus TaxID=38310 RepID=A0A2X4WX92_9NOCA|nr:hypothetical protein [Rhodococcus coprophilus]MBM7460930.1 hypothetical protein [Rhodococcus coprophilus]SQI28734.1 Uncharacterised protein [Rhodococcus coprophilus]